MNLEHLYCIHRSQDTERMENLKLELNKTSLTPIFIEPEVVHDNFKKSWFFNESMNSLRETTIKIIEEAIDKGFPYITIMEDDCVFLEKEFNLVYEKDLPSHFNFIHFNVTGNQSFGPVVVNGVFRQLNFANCCQFYIVSSNMYKPYLHYLKKHMVPIDEVTLGMHQKYGHSFVVEPMPITHEPGKYSTLRDRQVSY